MDTGPAISVTGVTKAHAMRAVKWLRARNMLAFYRAADRSLNALVTKHGPEQTERSLRDAYAATAR